MIADTPYISLRTFRRSGDPVDTPVWFATQSPTVHYVFSAADAGKVKRLRHTRRVSVASCDMRGGSVGAWHDCTAVLIDDQAEQQQAYALLTKKYGWQMRLTNFFSRLTGRINNRAVIRIDSAGN